MMNDETKSIALINDGKVARLLLTNLSPILDQIKLDAEQKFMGEFRSGKLNEGNSLAYAAVMSTIEDIRNRLKQKINQGDRQVERRSNTDDVGI